MDTGIEDRVGPGHDRSMMIESSSQPERKGATTLRPLWQEPKMRAIGSSLTDVCLLVLMFVFEASLIAILPLLPATHFAI